MFKGDYRKDIVAAAETTDKRFEMAGIDPRCRSATSICHGHNLAVGHGDREVCKNVDAVGSRIGRRDHDVMVPGAGHINGVRFKDGRLGRYAIEIERFFPGCEDRRAAIGSVPERAGFEEVQAVIEAGGIDRLQKFPIPSRARNAACANEGIGFVQEILKPVGGLAGCGHINRTIAIEIDAGVEFEHGMIAIGPNVAEFFKSEVTDLRSLQSHVKRVPFDHIDVCLPGFSVFVVVRYFARTGKDRVDAGQLQSRVGLGTAESIDHKAELVLGAIGVEIARYTDGCITLAVSPIEHGDDLGDIVVRVDRGIGGISSELHKQRAWCKADLHGPFIKAPVTPIGEADNGIAHPFENIDAFAVDPAFFVIALSVGLANFDESRSHAVDTHRIGASLFGKFALLTKLPAIKIDDRIAGQHQHQGMSDIVEFVGFVDIVIFDEFDSR